MALPPRFTTMPGGQAQPFRMNLNPLIGQSMPPIKLNSISVPSQPHQKPSAVTTVFVGNITDKADNDFVKHILTECGHVSNWKRIQGTNQKYQSFGFCDFSDPESALRALRVLNEFHIGDKKLNVKVDAKVREQLLKFARQEAGPNAAKASGDDLPASEEALKKDEEVRLKILNMIEKEHPDLVNIGEDGEVSDKEKEDKKGAGEHDERRLRKKDDESSRRTKESASSKRRRSASRGRSRERSPRRRRGESPRSKRRRRSSSRSSSGSSSSRSSSSSSEATRSSRGGGGGRGGGGRRSRRSRTASRGRAASSEDSDDARERRLLKKTVKEKEVAYNQRLKQWEQREKKMGGREIKSISNNRTGKKKMVRQEERREGLREKKAKRYERDEQKEKSRKLEMLKEAKKLKAFLEDYDDDKDDLKYYKSSSLFARRREFEREKEADAKDRQKEQQEIEELKKIIIDEAKGKKEEKEIEEEARRRHKEKEEKAASQRSGRDGSGSPNPHHKLGRPPLSAANQEEDDDEEGGSSSSDSGGSEDEGANGGGETAANGESTECKMEVEEAETEKTLEDAAKWTTVDADGSTASSSATPAALHQASASPRPVLRTASPAFSAAPTLASASASNSSVTSLGMRLGRVTGTTVASVFGGDDDDDPLAGKKKLKLFEITQEERMKTMTPGEIKKMQKDIADSIPATKEALFAYAVPLRQLEQSAAFPRIHSWVSKKIKEYLGEEEASLVNFICEQLQKGESPEKIKDDIKMVLDDDAELFVSKLWRLVVYESECALKGIPASTSRA